MGYFNLRAMPQQNMQAITPVDVHVENDWREGLNNKRNVKTSNRGGRQTTRMRTHVIDKTRTKKTKVLLSTHIPKQVVVPKLVLPGRSRSPSPNRGPWVPPPGRSTKGQKVPWQNTKSRLEINPVTEILIDADQSLDTERHRQLVTSNSLSTVENEKLMRDIQIYEKRIQGLIDGIGILKERTFKHANRDETDQLRSDIDASLFELEQLQQTHNQRIPNRSPKNLRSQSPSPIRVNKRSCSADEPRQRPKVSFQDDPIIERRRARSTTPAKGPIHLNRDRERLLISLAQSETDIAQITKQLSSVKDILTKLKLDDQPVSFEVGQLHQHRNELLHLIEQFERSNSQLKEFLRHQYHLEAEHGIINNKYDTLKTRIHELEHENNQIRRLLLNRENDNIALLTELERIKTHTIGFDTMKTSLEHNRAHLQRELYAKEGEINRLQCALRSLGRDLHHTGYQCGNIHRSIKRRPLSSTPSRPCASNIVSKTRAISTERLQIELNDRDHQINELKKKLCENKNEQTDDTNSEIIHLRTKLEQVEHLANEYKAQLYTQTLKTSANNSKNHLSEIELDKIRTRLQRRIEELEPLPELLRQAELKNDQLAKHILELQRHLTDHSTFVDRTIYVSSDNDPQSLQRQIVSLVEQNERLSTVLNSKEEELRIAQAHLSSRTHEVTSVQKQTDFIIRDDTFGSNERYVQKNTFDIEQQMSNLRLEYTQLKREKDELERRFTSQLRDLRDKLHQSNNTNRTMQNYVNSLKTTYASLFNDTIPASLTRYTTT